MRTRTDVQAVCLSERVLSSEINEKKILNTYGVVLHHHETVAPLENKQMNAFCTKCNEIE